MAQVPAECELLASPNMSKAQAFKHFREAIFFEAPGVKSDWLNKIITIAKGKRLRSFVMIEVYEAATGAALN